MAQLSDNEVGWLVTSYRKFADPATAAAVVFAESNGNTLAFRGATKNPNGGNDRGLWQINSKWHPEVTDAMAFDPYTATAEAFRISNSGADFTQWSTAKNGRLDLARGTRALTAPTAPKGAPAGAGTPTAPADAIGPNGDPTKDNGALIGLDKLLYLVREAGVKDRATLITYGAAAHAASGIPGLPAVNLYDDGKTQYPPSGIGAWGINAAEATATGLTPEQFRTAAGNVSAIMQLTKNGADLTPLTRWKGTGFVPAKWIAAQAIAARGLADLELTESQGGNPWYFTKGSVGAVNEELKVLDAGAVLGQVSKLISAIMSVELWRRIGWVALGLVLAGAGIYLFVKP